MIVVQDPTLHVATYLELVRVMRLLNRGGKMDRPITMPTKARRMVNNLVNRENSWLDYYLASYPLRGWWARCKTIDEIKLAAKRKRLKILLLQRRK